MNAQELLEAMRNKLVASPNASTIDLQVQQIASHSEIGRIRQSIEEIEAGIAGELAGDKSFPNADARKAEVTKRLVRNQAWRDLQDALRAELAKKQTLEARISEIDLQRKSFEVEIRAMGHVANLLAADLQHEAAKMNLKAAGCQLKAVSP